MSSRDKTRLWGLFYLLIAAFAAFRCWVRLEEALAGRAGYFWVVVAAVSAVVFTLLGIHTLVVREPESPTSLPTSDSPTGGAP